MNKEVGMTEEKQGKVVSIEAFRRDIKTLTFCRYILSRLKLATIIEDDIHLYIDEMAEVLGVRLEIRGAKEALYEAWGNLLGEQIEKILTGAVWDEQADQPGKIGG
jgi:uncharacterized protein YuzE